MNLRIFLFFLLPTLVQGWNLCQLVGLFCDSEQQGEDGSAPLVGYNAGDHFGWSTALSNDGNTLAVGSISGPVRVLQHDGERWNQVGLEIISALDGDLFGYSIDLSGDGTTVAIGAPAQADEFATDESMTENAGRAGVFRYDGTEWVLLGVPLGGDNAGDRFGASIALSDDGTILAVGAPISDGAANIAFTSSGRVRVYQWTGLEWQQMGSEIDGESFFDRFGTSVALSADGKTLAVGATHNDANGMYDQGHVRVYYFDGAVWSQRGKDLDGGVAGGQLGGAVSLSDNGMVVAATSSQGKGRVYSFAGSDWYPLGSAVTFTGTAIEISGNGRVIVIGGEGRVRLFNLIDSNWAQIGSDLESTDLGFGQSVGLSQEGLTIAVGAPLDNEERGRVRVFELT